MKRSTATLVLLLACGMVAAGDADPNAPWVPKKGETVYVSAGLVMSIPSVFAVVETQIPPCIAAEVTKAGTSKWKIDPPNTPPLARPKLVGPWLARLHRTAQECETAFTANGQPKIVRRGPVHEIIPESQTP